MWLLIAQTKVPNMKPGPSRPWGGEDVALLVGAAFAAIFLLFLLRALLRIRRARHLFREVGRRANLQCVRCGYDVRATAERCPECGEPVPEAWREARRSDSAGWPPPRG